jgi:hypothetical protein
MDGIQAARARARALLPHPFVIRPDITGPLTAGSADSYVPKPTVKRHEAFTDDLQALKVEPLLNPLRAEPTSPGDSSAVHVSAVIGGFANGRYVADVQHLLN